MGNSDAFTKERIHVIPPDSSARRRRTLPATMSNASSTHSDEKSDADKTNVTTDSTRSPKGVIDEASLGAGSGVETQERRRRRRKDEEDASNEKPDEDKTIVTTDGTGSSQSIKEETSHGSGSGVETGEEERRKVANDTQISTGRRRRDKKDSPPENIVGNSSVGIGADAEESRASETSP